MPARPRVTLLVHNLAGNPIVRAAPLAAALARDFEVEVLGLSFGGEVYAPYRGQLPVRAVPSGARPGAVLAGAVRLSRMAAGDVLYACKPLLSTLLPALIAPRRRPVLLDVEDDEWASREVEDDGSRGARALLRRAADVHGLIARAAHPLTRRAFAVTVASRALQARYGGTLVRHGPDEAAWDPARPELADRAALRAAFGLPPGRRLALFAGLPRAHKGWLVLLDALKRPEAAGWDLAAAGEGGAWHDLARVRLGPRFHPLGPVERGRMPALTAAADAVPVAQRPGPVAEAQVPAKALEAMAMGVPVVGTAVGDLPEILGGGARGWLVPPDDAAALAGALAAVAADPAESARRAAAARAWYLAEASVGAIRERLVPLVEAALRARGARR